MRPVVLELLNVQSLTNESGLIHENILDNGIDVTCLAETWHKTSTRPAPLGTATWPSPVQLAMAAGLLLYITAASTYPQCLFPPAPPVVPKCPEQRCEDPDEDAEIHASYLLPF